MEKKSVKMEFDCIHDQAGGTMTCSWLGGRVKIVCDWKSATGVVLVRDEVKLRFSLVGLSVKDFMLLEVQTAEAAAQLARFNLAEMLELRVQQEQERLRSLGLTP